MLSNPRGSLYRHGARMNGKTLLVSQKVPSMYLGVCQKLRHSQPRQCSTHCENIAIQYPPETSNSSSTQKSNECEQVDFRQQWYAVHTVDSLPEDRPWPITVLGRDLVIWKDSLGEWRAFDDLCPHRKVALSEGRVEADGTLACAYHGWRFDGSGQCTEIPQLGDDKRDQRLQEAAPACATAFPTAVKDGLLFVWMVPGADGLLQSSLVPVPHDAEADGKAIWVQPWYSRRMPMSWEMLMENLTDPSHVPFSHHGIGSNDRSKPAIRPYDTVERYGKNGFLITSSTPRRGGAVRDMQNVSWFPSMHTVDALKPAADSKEAESFHNDTLVFRGRFYCTPSTKTSSLMVMRLEAYGNKAIAEKNSKISTWAYHMLINSPIADGDMVFLHRQSVMTARGELRGMKDYYMPAASDLGTREFWRHLNIHCKDGINYYPHSPNTDILPAEVLLDRYSQHVEHCKDCKAMYDNIQKGLAAAAVAAISCLVFCAACVATGALLRAAGFAVVAVAAAVGWSKLRTLLKKFTFEKYIHAEKN